MYKRQVVENINGGLAKVAELLGRNEAELATAAVDVYKRQIFG